MVANAPDVELIGTEGAAMMERVEKGFGRKMIDVGYRSTDFEVLANMQANSYVHAAFKNHSFQGQLRDLLVDGKGGIRSFADFKRAAGPMVANYYGPWLKAEHQTAVTTGKMAAKWQQFESRKRLFPFLTYLTVGDQRVRDSHRALDRITKHIDDPFWDIHFPPNGWRCRCDVSSGKGPEVDGGIRTSEEQHPPQFRHNAGKEGRFWKEGQEPYRPKELPARQEAQKAASAAQTKSLMGDGDELYTSKTTGSSIIRHRHWEQRHRDVAPKNYRVFKAFADAVAEQLIRLPRLPFSVGLPEPDGFVNGLTADVKEQEGSKLARFLKNAITGCLPIDKPGKERPQKAQVLIASVLAYNRKDAYAAIRGKMQAHPGLMKRIVILEGDKLIADLGVEELSKIAAWDATPLPLERRKPD